MVCRARLWLGDNFVNEKVDFLQPQEACDWASAQLKASSKADNAQVSFCVMNDTWKVVASLKKEASRVNTEYNGPWKGGPLR